jgi:hypothetical protein
MDSKRSKSIVIVGLYTAVFLAALSTLLIHMSTSAADDAVRRYGYNADSGVVEWLLGVLYGAPLALLFGFASLALSRHWRIGMVAHWLAVAAVVALPFIDYFCVF